MAARKVNWSAVLFGLMIVFALAVLGYSAFQWLEGNTPNPPLPQDSSTARNSPTAAASDLIVSEAAKPVPDYSFVNAEGSSHKLTDYKGKYVLVNFWATWCGPCKLELPSLAKLKKDLGNSNLEVLTISVDKSAAVAAKYLAKKGLTDLDTYADPSLDLSTAVGANAIPTTILIDPQSKIIGRHVGGADWDSPTSIAALQKITSKG